eukprot:Blabericola_migrator_1__4192@NODE_2285_length_2997_cov_343_626621_g1435_i0_p2_GENE_NODE_2285_length_2997_cov_343_626621_g1435_i0NODE_2285_length_2997_cov_343_626621_g1435_i0_p2_ORF_typecomplete_len115_score11_45_NODE_2285_length_2997_cov_343_626621_g1435_i010971441
MVHGMHRSKTEKPRSYIPEMLLAPRSASTQSALKRLPRRGRSHRATSDSTDIILGYVRKRLQHEQPLEELPFKVRPASQTAVNGLSRMNVTGCWESSIMTPSRVWLRTMETALC